MIPVFIYPAGLSSARGANPLLTTINPAEAASVLYITLEGFFYFIFSALERVYWNHFVLIVEISVVTIFSSG
jgi:hypothetical protein